mmetsp:Transcript_34776/g.44359  ORF Transcript_34776/g.44359 Transcript_34776/m.44359 type:complete len:290 (-) Transcript_34776:23-892(-)
MEERKGERTEQELDDILNSALDELEDEENESDEDGGNKRTFGEIPDVKAMEQQMDENLANNLENLFANFNDPEVAASLEKTFQQLAGHADGDEQVQDFMQRQGDNSIDRTVARTLEQLSKAGAVAEGGEMSQMEAAGEEVMREMMQEFEKLGEKEDYNEVIENMMQQLLAKELMYEPVKSITERFPKWLAENKEYLNDSDYERFGKQYQCFQRIRALYETEPDNFDRLTELMQDMQEYGQVPSEIIKELAPGLEFNDDGMPIMPNLDQSMMPDMPMPFPGADAQQCAVM